VRLTGPKPGTMAVRLSFGPLGGSRPARLDFAADETGQPATRGYVEYGGKRLDASALVP
jgi:hypothetical protein